jgi:hypothetical protein
MRILTPTLGAGLKGLPESGQSVGLADLTTGAIGDALIALSDNVSEEDMEYICDTLAACTELDNVGSWVPLAADKDHWAGRYLEKFQWLIFALEVNYADFLGGKDSINRVSAMLRSAQKSKSPASSTGEPSASSPAPTTT